jgi:hypothetical protein
MPIGRDFPLPGRNVFRVELIGNPARIATDAFQAAFGRNPSDEELTIWMEFKHKYPKSTITSSATNLTETFRYLLTTPAGEIQRHHMVRAAAPDSLLREATSDEVAAWSQRIRRERLIFTDLVSAMRREGPFGP